MSINVMDYLHDINFEKRKLEIEDKKYQQFVINRGLSQFIENVFLANEMNKRNISNEMHYDFLLNSVDKRKRFGKWTKTNHIENDDMVDVVMERLNCNKGRAIESLYAMNEEDFNYLKTMVENVKKEG